MSTSIDDIWSQPISQPSSPKQAEITSPGRPSKRKRSTLFLAGSDEESDFPTNASPKAPSRPDIDSLFENLDEPTGDAEVTRAFDLEAYRREAGKRAAAAAPPLPTPQEVQSSSPTGGNDTYANGRKKRKGGSDDDEPKERKPLPKLDHDRLLGRDGLPSLVAQSKNFKSKGKGHELSDLNRLINLYQFWAHKMFPKIQFSDLVERVEKLCHSKRMHVALSVWRDENRRHENSEIIDVDDINELSDKENESSSKSQDVPSSPSSGLSSRSSVNYDTDEATNPPTSASEFATTDDDFAMEYITDGEPLNSLSLEQGQNEQVSKGYSWGKGKQSAIPVEEDDDALWAEFDDSIFAFDDQPPNLSSEVPRAIEKQPPTKNQQSLQRIELDDDDMWDILDEIEENSAQKKAGVQSSIIKTKFPEEIGPPSAVESGSGGNDEPGNPALMQIEKNIDSQIHTSGDDRTSDDVNGSSTNQLATPTNDEGWDDMYV